MPSTSDRSDSAGRGLFLSWSGGKDSALALHALRREGEDVLGLITTVSAVDGSIPVHQVGRELLERQTAALGLPLHTIPLPPAPSNQLYEARLADGLQDLAPRRIAFGDLFLADLRAYREELFARLGWETRFPLWGSDTSWLAREFLALGFRARIVAGISAGRPFDADFLAALPEGVDPCGENGEFHTFVYDGPGFTRPVESIP